MQLALHLQHRASMPGNAGGKQVAIVQPQRRDPGQQAAAGAGAGSAGGGTPRAPRAASSPAPAAAPDAPRLRQTNMSPRSLALLNTTKATLWIESRKPSPRKSAREQTPPQAARGPRRAGSAGGGTPLLRMAVLRKAQSAQKVKVTKIEAPLKIDQTKQAAIMLMTGHTPKLKALSPKLASARKSPTFLVKKPSPVRKTPRSGGRKSGRSPKGSTPDIGVTPKRAGTHGDSSLRSSKRSSAGQSVSVLEITDSDARNSTLRASSVKSTKTLGSPLPPSPKKSSLKDPSAKSSTRKTESIKFDLSNLENYSQDQSSDVFVVTDNTALGGSASEADETLHYDTSGTKSPSPRKPIHSRSSSRGKWGSLSESRTTQRSDVSAGSPPAKKSLRGNVPPAGVEDSQTGKNTTANSRRSSRTDRSRNTTVAFKTRTLSPRNSNQNLESYSIVDLVSIDSNESAKSGSVYDSAGSTRSSSIVFGTPRNSSGRKMRSTIEPTLLGSSTPYIGKARTSARSQSSPNISARTTTPNKSTRRSNVSRRSKSLTTPENTQKHISVNSTRISRASKSRSRINDSDLQYIDDGEAEESPKSSRRGSRADMSHNISNISTASSHHRSLTPNKTKSPQNDRTRTPNSSGDEGSPALIVRSQRGSTRGSQTSQQSQKRVSANIKRKTIGIKQSERKSRSDLKSESLNISKRKLSKSLRLSKDTTVSPSVLNDSTSGPQNERRSSRKDTTIANSPRSERRSSGNKQSLNTSSDSPQNEGRSSRKDTTVAGSPRSERRSSGKKQSLNTTSDSPQNERRSSRKDTTVAYSPRSERRSTHKTLKPNTTTGSPKIDRRRLRKNLSLNITAATSSQNDGTITPEHINSPQEVGTPILSIQSLLDSSQSSFASQRSRKTPVSKRKTVGVARPERKGRSSLRSKSLNISKGKSSRLTKQPSIESDGTDENALQPDNEDTVTPKSAVKLVHEAVKNKHSTAKKPQSKRSLIDNLNDSDIIKHLFNSPVKRKLSQSMTEFSRKRLFDDDEVVPKRPTRNTVALTGRTPDNSFLLDHTENITADKFVSPLSTPSNSPNLTGIKRLYQKKTPQNDLRNVKGVKALLKTPRPRRSVKNDLTNVAGVKGVFAEGPSNDLRRVSGVKSLFQSQIVAKNDLSDVRGVRNLFKKKSPANDLRNVSGVKKTLQRRSPKNDLSDVRGVRRMFRREKQRNALDVSGIAELFNESDSSYKDSEKLFDQLVGKPPIKAVYSKSFLSKGAQKHKQLRKTKSLQIPIETITYSPEEWLEQELRKHLHRDNAAKRIASPSKAGKSLNKSGASKANVTRELQYLVTDTVEGSAPILKARGRTSTIRKSRSETTEMKKSASELYSARKLPLKKRSLVDRSKSLLEKSSDKTKSNLLPLKKRAVVHSTPVKGRFYDSTMNASELGRVSPIAVVEKTQNLENDTTVRSTQRLTKNSPKAKGRAKSTLVENQGIEIEVQPETSRQPRGRRAANIKTINENTEPSPKPKGRRGAKAKTAEKHDTEIQTKSIGNKETSIETAPKTRRTRNNDGKGAIEAKASPKQRGARAAKARNVLQNDKEQNIQGKPSPKRIRAAKATALSILHDKSTRTRRKVDSTTVSNTKKRRQSLVIAKKPPVMSPKPEPKATRITKKTSPLTVSPKSSSRRQKSNKSNVKVRSPVSRQKVAVVVINRMSPKFKPKAAKDKVASPKVVSPAAPRSTRGRAGNAGEKSKKMSPKKTQGSKITRKAVEKPEVPEPETKRTRNTRGTNNDAEKPAAPKKTRSKIDSKESAQPEPAGRSRRAKADVPVPETTKSRKRKLPDDEPVISPKVTKSVVTKRTRGKPADQTITTPKATTSEVTRTTRGKQKDQTVASPKTTKTEAKKPTRGKKTVIELTEVETSKGRRKSTLKKVVTKVKIQGGEVENRTKKVSTKVVETKARKSPEQAAPVRGRKTTAAPVESAPQTRRKRKTSPVKAEPAKKARRGAANASPSPGKEPVARGRSTRGRNTDVSAARSRRR